jgi:hypothetical protein
VFLRKGNVPLVGRESDRLGRAGGRVARFVGRNRTGGLTLQTDERRASAFGLFEMVLTPLAAERQNRRRMTLIERSSN